MDNIRKSPWIALIMGSPAQAVALIEEQASTIEQHLVTIARLEGELEVALASPIYRPIPLLEVTTTTLTNEVAAAERRVIAAALELCEGNRTKAALRLGLTRRGLQFKLRALGIGPHRAAGK